MPYIPDAHKQYDLIPLARKYEIEVFEYSSPLLRAVEEATGEQIIPYGFSSYEAYDARIDELIEKHQNDPETVSVIEKYRESIRELNRKEEWSICRYIGDDDDEMPELGLQNGMCYYWPTSAFNPIFRGVIDGEAFTAYQYPTDPDLWEIVVDPTGMARRTIFEGNG